MITVFGIKQCDSCHKALKWLSDQNIPHSFHDMREQGLSKEMVSSWLASDFGDRLVNRRSTTWRTLSASEKEAQGPQLLRLLLDHPTLIKRPVFVDDRVLAVGFSAATLMHLLKGRLDD